MSSDVHGHLHLSPRSSGAGAKDAPAPRVSGANPHPEALICSGGVRNHEQGFSSPVEPAGSERVTDEVSEPVAGPLVSVTDVCAWLGVDAAEVRRLAEAGEITPLTRLGGGAFRYWRFHERVIGERFGLELPGPRERYLAEQRREEAMRRDEKDGLKRAEPSLIRVWGQWLYKLYDVDHNLLYVGITSQGLRRLEDHNRTKPWFHLIDHVEIEHFATREESEAREREMIRALAPPYNGTHNPNPQRYVPEPPAFDELVPAA